LSLLGDENSEVKYQVESGLSGLVCTHVTVGRTLHESKSAIDERCDKKRIG
jgi:hypothetical protein